MHSSSTVLVHYPAPNTDNLYARNLIMSQIKNLHNLLPLVPHECQLAASLNYPAISKEWKMHV